VRAENDCYKVKREAAALAGIASLGSDRGPETPAHSSPSNAREGSTGLTPPHRFSYRAPPLASPHSAGRFPGRSKVSRGWGYVHRTFRSSKAAAGQGRHRQLGAMRAYLMVIERKPEDSDTTALGSGQARNGLIRFG
jgi:hypothetical protein